MFPFTLHLTTTNIYTKRAFLQIYIYFFVNLFPMPTRKDLKSAITQRFIATCEILQKRTLISAYNDLAKTLQMSTGQFSDIRHGRKDVTVHALSLLKNAYPVVNLDYILTGNGSALIESSEIQHKVAEPGDEKVATLERLEYERVTGNNIRVLPILVDSANREHIPLVGSRAAASYIDNLQQPEFFKAMPTLSLPYSISGDGTLRAFEVEGSSMEPTVMEGSIVIAAFVENWAKNIVDGRIYIIITNDSIQLKRIRNRIPERGQLWADSDNPEYIGRPIPVRRIEEVWEMKREIRSNFPNLNKDIMKTVHTLEIEMEEVKDLLNLLAGGKQTK
jgi:SOS-response transcriptional repressor LexA